MSKVKKHEIVYKNFYNDEKIINLYVIENDNSVIGFVLSDGYLHQYDNNYYHEDELIGYFEVEANVNKNIDSDKIESIINYVIGRTSDEDNIKMCVTLTLPYWEDARIFENGWQFRYCYDIYDTNKIQLAIMDVLKANYYETAENWKKVKNDNN